MHEMLVIDANYINKVIPTLRLKNDLAGKSLYFWEGGTADDIAVLTHDRKKDTLRVSVSRTRDSGWTPLPLKIHKEIEEISNSNKLHTNRFIYDMEGKELIYNLGEEKAIVWFYSYPPSKILLNKQYIVLWDEWDINKKNSEQKVSRLVQDSDNLVGLANFYNRTENFILKDTTTETGLNYSFLLTAHTFGLPLRTSNNTFLSQFCKRYKRGDNKLDPERIHENFENITLKALEDEEEEEKLKKELIGGEEKESQTLSLTGLLKNGMPSMIEAEISLGDHPQSGFPVQISAAQISGGFLVLYAEEDIDDYSETLKIFKTIFDFERIVLIDLYDTEYEEYKSWLH